MTRLLVALLVAAALPARAELAPVFADYWTNSGSLPPEHAWETSVIIREDGALELKHCKGYETEGPACELRSGRVSEEALDAIRKAASDSGLVDNPARETTRPTVGGGLTWGRVNLGDKTVELIPQPVESDTDRVEQVLQAIAAAIPPDFDPLVAPD
jgi:hypothetical protein